MNKVLIITHIFNESLQIFYSPQYIIYSLNQKSKWDSITIQKKMKQVYKYFFVGKLDNLNLIAIFWLMCKGDFESGNWHSVSYKISTSTDYLQNGTNSWWLQRIGSEAFWRNWREQENQDWRISTIVDGRMSGTFVKYSWTRGLFLAEVSSSWKLWDPHSSASFEELYLYDQKWSTIFLPCLPKGLVNCHEGDERKGLLNSAHQRQHEEKNDPVETWILGSECNITWWFL